MVCDQISWPSHHGVVADQLCITGLAMFCPAGSTCLNIGNYRDCCIADDCRTSSFSSVCLNYNDPGCAAHTDGTTCWYGIQRCTRPQIFAPDTDISPATLTQTVLTVRLTFGRQQQHPTGSSPSSIVTTRSFPARQFSMPNPARLLDPRV